MARSSAKGVSAASRARRFLTQAPIQRLSARPVTCFGSKATGFTFVAAHSQLPCRKNWLRTRCSVQAAVWREDLGEVEERVLAAPHRRTSHRRCSNTIKGGHADTSQTQSQALVIPLVIAPNADSSGIASGDENEIGTREREAHWPPNRGDQQGAVAGGGGVGSQ